MNFFVSDATGFIGSHFLNTLFKNGHEVVALRRKSTEPRIDLIKEPTWCTGKLNADWSKQLKSCDAFVHLACAGVNKNMNDWEYCFEVNVNQSFALWKSAIDSGIKNFLICGSCSEYGKSGEEYEYIPATARLKPVGAYGTSKAVASISAMGLARTFDLNLVVARLFHTFGKGEAETRFWPSLLKASCDNVDFAMSKGEQIRDFMPVADVSKELFNLAINLSQFPSGGIIKNIGTGCPVSLLEFATKEWEKRNSKGKLIPGAIPYRQQEIMRYVPLID